MTFFDLSTTLSMLRYLLVEGMGLTLRLTVICALIGGLLGGGLAVIRLYGPRWAGIGVGLFVDLMRSIPLILVIFWFYFLSPYLIAWIRGMPDPVQIDAFTSAVVTFSVFEACYYCEIIRAGLRAVARGQRAAGLAMGLNEWQTFRFVVLPQAIRSVMPLLVLQVIVLFQDVSLVYVLSLTDFLGAATQIAQQQNRIVEMYLFVAAVYFVICFVATRGVRRLQQHFSLR